MEMNLRDIRWAWRHFRGFEMDKAMPYQHALAQLCAVEGKLALHVWRDNMNEKTEYAKDKKES